MLVLCIYISPVTNIGQVHQSRGTAFIKKNVQTTNSSRYNNLQETYIMIEIFKYSYFDKIV